MSTELGMSFGDTHQEVYAKLLRKWKIKLSDVKDLSPALQAQWGVELEAALNEALNESLLDSDALDQWGDVNLPSKDTLRNFAKIALKYALVFASADLLRRYIKSVKMDKAHPPGKDISGAMKFYRPTELINRAAQTLAQVYDMARGYFNAVVGRFLGRKQELTGRRRWVSTGDKSRHAALHGQIRGEGEMFTYKKELISGPRPAGGSPHDWSNCSCRVQFERKDGTWIDVVT